MPGLSLGLGLGLHNKAVSGGGGGGAPATDPYWADVAWLFSSRNGAIEDLKGNCTSIAAAGSAAVSTAQAKFGTTSFAINPTGALNGNSYVNFSCPTALTGLLTFEFWVYGIGRIGSDMGIISSQTKTTNSLTSDWYSGDNHLYFQLIEGSYKTLASSTAAYSGGAWDFVAVTRNSSNIWNMAINGTLQTSGGVAYSQTLLNPFRFGRGLDGDSLYGYMDEIRCTVGVNRYPGNDFSAVPTDRFPNS